MSCRCTNAINLGENKGNSIPRTCTATIACLINTTLASILIVTHFHLINVLDTIVLPLIAISLLSQVITHRDSALAGASSILKLQSKACYYVKDHIGELIPVFAYTNSRSVLSSVQRTIQFVSVPIRHPRNLSGSALYPALGSDRISSRQCFGGRTLRNARDKR